MREGGLGSSDTASGEKQKEIFNDTRTDTVENTDPKTEMRGVKHRVRFFILQILIENTFFRKEHIYVFKSERKSESSGKEYDLLLRGGISNEQNTQLGR